MSLEQLMAFTVTTDHARQEQVWQALQRSYSQEPYQIRRMLTEKTVRASDRRALFVGLDAYEAAGGVVHARSVPAGRRRLAGGHRRCSTAWSPRS